MHAWRQSTASEPVTLEKLFQSNPSMGKYDPYNIAKVTATYSDLLRKGFTGQMRDAWGGMLSQDLLHARFPELKIQGWIYTS